MCFMHFRYTGSYNYGSYGNQHPPPMQSQYPALPPEAAISGPLHYAPYHRSSAQVSRWSCLLVLARSTHVTQCISTFCILCVQLCVTGKDGLFLSVTSALQGLPIVGDSHVHTPLSLTHARGGEQLSLVPPALTSLIPGSSWLPCLLPLFGQPRSDWTSPSHQHSPGADPQRVMQDCHLSLILTGVLVSHVCSFQSHPHTVSPGESSSGGPLSHILRPHLSFGSYCLTSQIDPL